MKAYYKNITTYYKYLNIVDAITVGTIDLVDGVASGFSSANYLILPFYLTSTARTWEFIIKLKVGPSTGYAQGILGRVDVNFYGICLNLGAENKLQLWLSSDGETNDIVMGRRWYKYTTDEWVETDGITCMDGNTIFQENDIVFVKIFFDGYKYQVESSEDGENWVEEISINNSNSIYVGDMPTALGYNHAEDIAPYECWTGDIYLNQCIAKVDDQIVWRGLDCEESDSDDYDFYITDTGYQLYGELVSKIYYKNITQINPDTGEEETLAVVSTEDDYDFVTGIINYKAVDIGDS